MEMLFGMPLLVNPLPDFGCRSSYATFVAPFRCFSDGSAFLDLMSASISSTFSRNFTKVANTCQFTSPIHF